MEKKKSLLLIFILSVGLVFLIYYNYKYDFRDSMFVITKDDTNGEISYYEINDKNAKREVSIFESDDIEIYETENCYASYIDRTKNKVLNKYMDETCTLYKEEENVEITSEFEIIIKEVSKLEHDISENKIIMLDDTYFVVVKLNVNLWTPYEFYKYNPKDNSLSLLYTFNGEDVIGIKLRGE